MVDGAAVELVEQIGAEIGGVSPPATLVEKDSCGAVYRHTRAVVAHIIVHVFGMRTPKLVARAACIPNTNFLLARCFGDCSRLSSRLPLPLLLRRGRPSRRRSLPLRLSPLPLFLFSPTRLCLATRHLVTPLLLVGEDVFCLLQLAAQASDRSRDLRCFGSEVVYAWGGWPLIVGRISWLLAPILIMAATRARPFTQDQTQRLHPSWRRNVSTRPWMGWS
mmetsp:Transcript_46736/g.105382  ORF Transcript_46736/g.105382 Transcript_46736/m.105382 type:complete len:220 (-) Transcript_46736:311-970(-)